MFILPFWSIGCLSQPQDEMLKEVYPDAKEINWRKDKNGNQEAHFKLNGTYYRADFTPDGSWIETERNIKWKELPPAVRYTINKEASKDDIVELEEVNHHEMGWFYDVEVKKKNKGKRDLVIAPDGQLIRKEKWK